MWIYKKGGTELINVLCRIFVKNYKDTKNPKVRLEYGIFAGIVGYVILYCFLQSLRLDFLHHHCQLWQMQLITYQMQVHQ